MPCISGHRVVQSCTLASGMAGRHRHGERQMLFHDTTHDSSISSFLQALRSYLQQYRPIVRGGYEVNSGSIYFRASLGSYPSMTLPTDARIRCGSMNDKPVNDIRSLLCLCFVLTDND